MTVREGAVCELQMRIGQRRIATALAAPVVHWGLGRLVWHRFGLQLKAMYHLHGAILPQSMRVAATQRRQIAWEREHPVWLLHGRNPATPSAHFIEGAGNSIVASQPLSLTFWLGATSLIVLCPMGWFRVGAKGWFASLGRGLWHQTTFPCPPDWLSCWLTREAQGFHDHTAYTPQTRAGAHGAARVGGVGESGTAS